MVVPEQGRAKKNDFFVEMNIPSSARIFDTISTTHLDKENTT